MKMRKYCIVILLMLLELGGVWFYKNHSIADTPLPQNLSISQVKISGDEFVVLRNNTDLEIQLSNYWLQYFNESSLAIVGVSNSAAQLPDAKLPAHREMILSTGLAPVCGQVLVAKLPFALKDSAGLVQVVAISQNSSIIGYSPQDQVSWSNAKTNNTADLKLPSSQDSKQIWFRNSPHAGWQSGLVDYNSACQGANASEPSESSAVALGDSTGTPPYVALGTGTGSSGNGIPAADAGLAPPQISELLPNPAPPQTDANDEFVELYNPNDKAFDLSGFILRTGTTSTKDFKMPEGTTIEPKGFEAFYIVQTHLTLSNSEGQAKLLDPMGNELTMSDVYTSAKDGQAWILAAGKWQWTTKPTPGAVNTVAAPVAKSSSSGSGSKSASSSANPANSSGSPAQSDSSRSINPLILAGVGAAALLYAGYEYRHDLANALRRLRRNRTVRGSAGPVVESTGSSRAAI